MINKNEIININIDDISSEGYGIGKIDKFVIFVEGAIKGDYCKIKIIKLKKNYGYGKLLEIIENSKDRVKEKCSIFNKCGGCSLQHIKYEAQLKFKTKKVKDSLTKIGKFKEDYINNIMENIEPMENPYRYRNKAQFPIGYFNGEINIGFFSKKTHNIINCDDCLIQKEVNKKITKIIYDHIKNYNIKAYEEHSHTGLIRHIVTRVGFFSEEIMVCLVINSDKIEKSLNISNLIEKLISIKNIKSIIINFNKEKTNVILGKNYKVLWGESFISDYIGDIKFKISCNSFFQINPIQTKLIYDKVLKFANLTEKDIIIDAYCGIGTISLFLAKKVKKVYGIEIIKSAVLDAKENAKINKIDNVEFIEGKSEEIILKFLENNIKINGIVIDPPRKGCNIELLKSILNIKPEKIIYVSCNPATLARDISILCESKYKLEKVKPFDMFPQTSHVETVCLLSRTSSI